MSQDRGDEFAIMSQRELLESIARAVHDPTGARADDGSAAAPGAPADHQDAAGTPAGAVLSANEDQIDVALSMGLCPAFGCGVSIGHGSLMCRRHWFMVPRELRTEVWSTWRHFLSNRATSAQLREVQVRALEAVNHQIVEAL